VDSLRVGDSLRLEQVAVADHKEGLYSGGKGCCEIMTAYGEAHNVDRRGADVADANVLLPPRPKAMRAMSNSMHCDCVFATFLVYVAIFLYLESVFPCNHGVDDGCMLGAAC